MYVGLHVKYPLFLSDLNETSFLDRFSENTLISNFMKTIFIVSPCILIH
jgi:hypothetical protein